MPRTDTAVHPTPLGVAAWRAHVAGGGDPLPLLEVCRDAALDSKTQAIWISLPTPAQWQQQQLDLLSLRLAEPGARAELVQRYPLLGVPFAAKPAGFNGLVGFKPTPGRISSAGVVPACRSIDCVSLFAHTVDDAAHLLAVAACS